MAEFHITEAGISSLNAYVGQNGGPTADLGWAQVFLVNASFDMNAFKALQTAAQQQEYLRTRAQWGYNLDRPDLIYNWTASGSQKPAPGNPPASPPTPLNNAAKRGLNLNTVANQYGVAKNIGGIPLQRGFDEVKYTYTIPVEQGTYLFNLMVIYNMEGVADPEKAEGAPIFAAYSFANPVTKIGGQGTIQVHGVIRYAAGIPTGAIRWEINTTNAANYLRVANVEALPLPQSLGNGMNDVYLVNSEDNIANTSNTTPYGRDSEGNSFTAVLKGGEQWAFPAFPYVISGQAGLPVVSRTTTQVVYDDSSLPEPLAIDTSVAGDYIIQFLDGSAKGACRMVRSIDTATKTIKWNTAVAAGFDSTKFLLLESGTKFTRRSTAIPSGLTGQVYTQGSPDPGWQWSGTGYLNLKTERPWVGPSLNVNRVSTANVAAPNVKMHPSGDYYVTAAQASASGISPTSEGVVTVTVLNGKILQTFRPIEVSGSVASSTFTTHREISWTGNTFTYGNWIYSFISSMVTAHPLVMELKRASMSTMDLTLDSGMTMDTARLSNATISGTPATVPRNKSPMVSGADGALYSLLLPQAGDPATNNRARILRTDIVTGEMEIIENSSLPANVFSETNGAVCMAALGGLVVRFYPSVIVTSGNTYTTHCVEYNTATKQLNQFPTGIIGQVGIALSAVADPQNIRWYLLTGKKLWRSSNGRTFSEHVEFDDSKSTTPGSSVANYFSSMVMGPDDFLYFSPWDYKEVARVGAFLGNVEYSNYGFSGLKKCYGMNVVATGEIFMASTDGPCYFIDVQTSTMSAETLSDPTLFSGGYIYTRTAHGPDGNLWLIFNELDGTTYKQNLRIIRRMLSQGALITNVQYVTLNGLSAGGHVQVQTLIQGVDGELYGPITNTDQVLRIETGLNPLDVNLLMAQGFCARS